MREERLEYAGARAEDPRKIRVCGTRGRQAEADADLAAGTGFALNCEQLASTLGGEAASEPGWQLMLCVLVALGAVGGSHVGRAG